MDARKEAGPDFATTTSGSGSVSAATPAASGLPHNAIVATPPTMNAAEVAAEEVVDTAIRRKITPGETPATVACPSQNPAWDTHSTATGQPSRIGF